MSTNGNGSRQPHEIQAEIERTRREMDGTLSAIEHRLTPGQIFDQGMSYLKDNGGTEFVSNLGEQAKQNPMPVALVGIGLAWLMATGRISNRNSNSGTEPDLGESGLMAKASQAKARLGERTAQVRDTTRQQIDRAKSSVDTMMHEQPLAIGAIGLAIGALAAALAPRTQKEEELVGRMNEAQYPDLSVDPLKKARDEERERLQQGVTPYAERAQSEPPV
jgi:ElaB/YqjD/DUF883 family membrane-anchored ribosome-binding protein